MNARLPHIALATLLLALALFQGVSAQLISIKSVPLATGDQFLTLPSGRLGMASVSIALDDALADPFVNPAKGALIEAPLLVASPTFYGISEGSGAGRTLPLTAYFRSEKAFGAFSFALQQIESGDPNGWWNPEILALRPTTTLNEASSTNFYMNAVIGRELGGGFSLGGGIALAKLNAVDGVEHLYVGNNGLDQSGHTFDVRTGVFFNRDGRQFEVVLLHNRFNMTHDVTWTTVVWDAESPGPTISQRVDSNLDRTRTWGLHLGFAQPLTESGWRIGAIMTANRKSHPKIPNYRLQNIPRDPGTSWAYNFGVGLAKTSGPATFGIDLVFEPIWSETWAEADGPVPTSNGGTIADGGKTIENDFFFTNVHVRVGLGYEWERAGFQIGVQGRSYDYSLDQLDNVEHTFREQRESWMEWTPSLGAALNLPEVTISYQGRLTTGTGRPGTRFDGVVFDEAPLGSDVILAPEAALTLQDARVLTHRVSVSIPIR